ncbi:uncharacterized protein At2g29880-like [Dioscorea cayenensis subsp. rotundata]|uniref:Uncharacterized protein At2g29880-like n=1 Tax=Dioscorea cayennensis subsp. rotundata TaxID=55577 RepID=A0AB40C3L1_DIOCR|nr:uncharacterized protein At2g29880-like [Dioscorea cayenensis subsp. rotundata]
MANQEKTDTRAKWNENHRAHLVKLLGDYNVPAYRSQNGWTKEAWNRILRDMVMKFPNLKCTVVQVKALEKELKKIYKLLKGFTELSGFGWDYEKNMVEATEEVWAPLLERNKEARRWHQKPFPYFTALQEIYEGRYAEGRRSRDVDYYANVPMDTPSPSIPAPNDPIQSLSTPEIEIEDPDFAHVEPPCSQPNISQPQNSCYTSRQRLGDEVQRRKKDRKRKNVQESFLEQYIDMRRAETDRYIDAMKKNQVEEKYTIGECMAAFNVLCDQFPDEDFVKITTLFKDKDNREIFLSLISEERKVLWIRQMIN